MNREVAVPWTRAGIGFSSTDFGIGINVTLSRGRRVLWVVIGPFYAYVQVGGQ